MGYAGHEIAWGFAKLAGFIIMSFIFAYIFWMTEIAVKKYAKKK